MAGGREGRAEGWEEEKSEISPRPNFQKLPTAVTDEHTLSSEAKPKQLAGNGQKSGESFNDLLVNFLEHVQVYAIKKRKYGPLTFPNFRLYGSVSVTTSAV